MRITSHAQINAVSVVDPRPTVEQVLSLAPLLTRMFTTLSGTGNDFDIALIPNTQSVTDSLTHNVTVVVDDGKTVRFEGYSSLPMPLQLAGLETYAYLIAVQLFSFAF